MEPMGKTALVTGGAHRVGKAIAVGLARAGANIVVNYHTSAAAAEKTAAEIRALGVDALALQADIADPSQVEAMVARASEVFGGIDILVNSADTWVETPIPTRSHELWQMTTGIGIDGPYYVSNAVAPWMIVSGEGVIVNIIDLSVWEPWPRYTAHAVSKSALLALTRQLALELAPHVRVNAIAPGPVLPPPGWPPERVERVADKTLLDRWGSPQDIVDAVLYFVRANYVTGETLAVDGGERFGHRKREAG